MVDKPYYGYIPNPFIDSLELSVRASNVLRNWGRVNTLKDFTALDKATVMALPGAGVRTWTEVQMVQAALRTTPVATSRPAREAGVFTAWGIGELHQMVSNLAREGFRIVTVIDTQNGDYHVVVQKENGNG
jgi:hypothetical protein